MHFPINPNNFIGHKKCSDGSEVYVTNTGRAVRKLLILVFGTFVVRALESAAPQAKALGRPTMLVQGMTNAEGTIRGVLILHIGERDKRQNGFQGVIALGPEKCEAVEMLYELLRNLSREHSLAEFEVKAPPLDELREKEN